jgi:hypothetical protein
MSDALRTAVDEIQAKIKAHLDEVADLKRAANALSRIIGTDPPYPDADQDQETATGPSRPDVYYGKPLTTAAREFLEFRKRACTPEEILKGMEQGGFDFEGLGWKGEHKLRSLSVSLSKNTAVFRRLPNGMFGLNAWYQDTPRRRGKGGSAADVPAVPTQEQPKADQPVEDDEVQSTDVGENDEVGEQETGSVNEPTEPVSEA